MPLSLDACAVGNVTIIRCTGRIVAGADADALRRRVSALLPDCREIVLHLGNVAFVDWHGDFGSPADQRAPVWWRSATVQRWR